MLMFSICQFGFHINTHLREFVTFIFGKNLKFSYQHSKCKQELYLQTKELRDLYLFDNSTIDTHILVDYYNCLTEAL